MARILLGVTGGIAAYKACELVRLLVRAGHDVTPIVTARRRALRRGRDVLGARAEARSRPTRTRTSRTPTLLVVAPLTANTLARLAHGLADDLLTETALAHRGALARRAGDEHGDVGAPCDAGQPRSCSSTAGRPSSAPSTGSSQRASSAIGRMSEPEEIARRVEALARRRRRRRRGAARRASRARHRRRHPRAARRGALPRQPLLRPHGRRARRGGARPWRRRDAARGEPPGACAGGRRGRADADRGRPSSRGPRTRPTRTSS